MPEIPLSSLDDRARKLVENAQIALQRGNPDYVADVCAAVLKTAPGCLPVRRLQRVAQLRQQRGKRRMLAKVFGAVAQVGLLFSKKEPARQLEQAEKLLQIDPTSVPALKRLAEAAQAMGLPETAAFAWEAVRELQPHDRETSLALGEAYLAGGQADRALATADAWLRAHPQDGDALALMRKASVAQTMNRGNWEAAGSFRGKLRDADQAVSLEQAAKVVTAGEMMSRLIAEAEQRLAREPDNLNHYRTIIDGHRKRQDPAQALHWVQKARALPAGAADPAFEQLETDLRVAVLEQRCEEAEAARAARPADPAAAAAAEEAKRALAARRLDGARAFVERYPNDLAARHTLGTLLLETGDYEQAIAHFQQAQKNPKVRVAALTGMGRALKARRMFDLAVAQFQIAKSELAAMDELKKEVIYELATCLEGMGRKEEAIAEFKAIYSEDIGFRDVAQKINAHYAAR